MAYTPHNSSGLEPSASRLDASLAGTDVVAAGTDNAEAVAAAGPGAAALADMAIDDASIDEVLVDDSFIDDALIERHYAVVYRLAYRLSGSVWAAEDITQEAFVQAIAHREQLRVAEAERGWILSIARRAYMRWLRRQSRPTYGRTLAQGDAEQTDVWQALPQEQACNVEQRVEHEDWLQSALGTLGEDARLVLVMYYFEELSYAQIAEQLQIPIGTVMSRLSRARGQLRVALERFEQRRSAGGARRTDAAGLAWPASLHTGVVGEESRHG